MANIPIPQQGQPIDQTYLYKIVETLNALSTSVSATYSGSTIQNPKDSVKETRRINELSIATAYYTFPDVSTVKSSTEKSFTVDFGMTFKNPPIVTITPQVLSGSAGRDVSVVIDKVDVSKVSGWIAFNTDGTTSIAVNVIAVGIPS